jgi:hypothetical protein
MRRAAYDPGGRAFAGLDGKSLLDAFLESDGISSGKLDENPSLPDVRGERWMVFLRLLGTDEELSAEVNARYPRPHTRTVVPVRGGEARRSSALEGLPARCRLQRLQGHPVPQARQEDSFRGPRSDGGFSRRMSLRRRFVRVRYPGSGGRGNQRVPAQPGRER